MRIISGEAGGKKLYSPKGNVRPMRAQVREALFNILGPQLKGRFLDLFAGSGAVGLEAVSRGMDHATFVEISGRTCKTINRNIRELGFSKKRCRIIRKNVMYFLNTAVKNEMKFDIIFAGTPYIDNVIRKIFDRTDGLISMLNPGGILIIQSSSQSDIKLPEKFDIREYGKDYLCFYYK